MSSRLCCYKQQQHCKLLAQFVFKVSAFRFNRRMKTRAPLPDCRINNALIQFVPRYQDTRTQFVDVLDPPFSDSECSNCSIISCLVVGSRVHTTTRTHSTFGDRAFAAAGPRLWNSLPPHLRHADLS